MNYEEGWRDLDSRDDATGAARTAAARQAAGGAAVTPSEVPAGVVAAAQQADLDGRPGDWQRVPDAQVRRLIAGAVTAERERALLAFAAEVDDLIADFTPGSRPGLRQYLAELAAFPAVREALKAVAGRARDIADGKP